MTSANPSRRPLPAKKAMEILTQLVNESPWLENEPWTSPKREQWKSTARGVLERAFLPGSSILQKFDTADALVFNPDTGDEEMRRMVNSTLKTQVAILSSGREQLSWESEDRPEPRGKNPPATKASTDQNGSSGIPAFDILSQAIRAVPSVKWALGVAGIVSVIAIIKGLKVDFRIAVFGTIIMVILMTLLVIFARLAKVTPNKLTLPAIVFTWFVLIITIATATLLFTSVFWRWPVDLQNWLGQSTESSPKLSGNQTPIQASASHQRPADWRVIADWQKARVAAVAARYPNHTVRILASSLSDETWDYADQFKDLFTASGWKVVGPETIPIDQPAIDIQFSISEKYFGSNHPDVFTALESEMRLVGLKKRAGVVVDPLVKPDELVIWVGARDPVGFPQGVPLRLGTTCPHPLKFTDSTLHFINDQNALARLVIIQPASSKFTVGDRLLVLLTGPAASVGNSDFFHVQALGRVMPRPDVLDVAVTKNLNVGEPMMMQVISANEINVKCIEALSSQ